MRKQLLLSAFGSLLLLTEVPAQTAVITNSFEEWQNEKPVGWNGSTTHSSGITITQITSGVVYGSSAVELQVPNSTHRRFSSAPTSIEEGVEYQFRFYAKGKGDIRVGLYDDNPASENLGYEYSSYTSLNSAEWKELVQTIIADRTTSTAQFIFSVRNTDPIAGHIQIDNISVTSRADDVRVRREGLNNSISVTSQVVDVRVGLNIGNQAPDLTYRNPEGKMISLSSLRGKIVLIHFWANWCGPCRYREFNNPAIVRAYEKYKDLEFKDAKEFTIYSFSLDKNIDVWKTAIKNDNLKWPNHVSDQMVWASSAVSTYQVKAIPAYFLIDANGIIIAKGDRASPFLDSELYKLLENTKKN